MLWFMGSQGVGHDWVTELNWTESRENSIPTLVDDFEGFKTSVKEVTAGVVETARKLELKVEPKDVSELLQFQAKTWMNEELLLRNV